MLDLSLIRAFDSETPKFGPGRMAPRIVCASVAQIVDGQIRGELIENQSRALAVLRSYLESGFIIVFANAPYDLACAAQADPTLLPLIFRALREGRIFDILTAQSLDAIYYGHLGRNPDGSELRKSSGAVTNRYSLEIVTNLVLGRADAKKNDTFRTSYALLEDIPVRFWPAEAVQYPIDDAGNTIEDAIVQMFGRRAHAWIEVPAIPGLCTQQMYCTHCGASDTASRFCPKAPIEPHKNIDNLPRQVEADFALKLGAAHSLRTDPERVEKLAAEVEQKHAAAVKRFQAKGWIRPDGSEDQAVVKRAVAVAYGASGKCPRCGGTGTIRNTTWVECRGAKVRGRYQGCEGDGCVVCHDRRIVPKLGNPVTCKNVFDERGEIVEEGCDGTGLHLSTAPMLPRTTANKKGDIDKLGVKTNRDTLMESGDEDLADYGENEFEKSRTTYVPYLRTGVHRPLYYSFDVLKATGRCSIENSPLHQMPRNGGERGCIRARGAWCGYPIEMVLGSTDYEAGELCTLSQLTYWLFGYSQMRDAINKSGKPGILHSDLAAEVLGIPLEEFLVRLKAKDKTAVDFRQAMKPIQFGVPGGMGDPKLVLTNRQKSAGFTVAERGPAKNAKGEPGYWGIRFCILTGGAQECGVEKVTEWKKYPCAPVCKFCVRTVADILRPAYFRRYPEVKDYHKWGAKKVDAKQPAPCVVWDPESNAPKIIRERGGCDFSAFLNNGFQGMLADIMKDAYVTATRECYLGVKDDGSPSPLAGCRLPLVIHDEPVSELILKTAHISGPRLAKIMVASGKKIAPDLAWKAETALAFYLSKSMEPVYDAMGNLIPWKPSKKKAE